MNIKEFNNIKTLKEKSIYIDNFVDNSNYDQVLELQTFIMSDPTPSEYLDLKEILKIKRTVHKNREGWSFVEQKWGEYLSYKRDKKIEDILDDKLG